ncbi:hypothetical protein Aca07nite_84520 [Actinoplanes capillaceus]|uniref:Uncharacterized protein n=1 Tax=Actinoplanes campanulatus TaxID=113559 RepID=A0ABQ3WY10_9ACTN|nr:hypothetical protein [Actinoplanes capillaceus]GID51177.1 hypothetical protein Aca07nite_84520 [Actinoplanes capillaceus]
MGAHAVVTIIDRQGQTRSYWAPWASPDYLVPAVAEFVAWADQQQYRLTADTWLAFADTYPGTLPREDVTGTAAADPADVGDLDYRYELVMHDDSRALRLRVFQLRDPGGQPRSYLFDELTRATLFGEAARLCDLLADRADQRPGDAALADSDAWRRRAKQFRQLHSSRVVTALAANLGATTTAATFAEPYPSIVIAGVQVVTYTAVDGTVHIAVYPGDADTWSRRPDGTPAVRITIEDTVVYGS